MCPPTRTRTTGKRKAAKGDSHWGRRRRLPDIQTVTYSWCNPPGGSPVRGQPQRVLVEPPTLEERVHLLPLAGGRPSAAMGEVHLPAGLGVDRREVVERVIVPTDANARPLPLQ